MLTQTKQDALVRDIVRDTHESIDLVDLGSRVLPPIERLFDASTSLLYHATNVGKIVPIKGGLSEGVPFYTRHYFASDPLQKTVMRTNPKVLIGSAMPNWKDYLASGAFHECATRYDMDYFLFIRVSSCRIYEPGMVGLMIARTFRQSDFTDRDLSIVKTILPALEALVRREDRLDERIKVHSYVETLMELAHTPTVILDLKGAYIWASERAEALLSISINGCRRVPQELENAAKRLGTFLDRSTNGKPPPTSLTVSRDQKEPLKANMRLARNRSGNHFVIIELDDAEVLPQFAAIAAGYQLTAAETQVLQLIAIGLNDQEIGNRLFITFATVRSHINQILGKLGVKSRTQAALIAHGHKITALD